MSLILPLDRGNIDSLGELRPTFQGRDLKQGGFRGLLVTGGGKVALAGGHLFKVTDKRPGEPYLLGADQTGLLYVAWTIPESEELPAGVNLVPITEAAFTLTDDESFLAAQAVALARWHSGDRFCTKCGARVHPVDAGWASVCSGCSNVNYPRTDPVVIVRVMDLGERILLAHNAAWPRPTLSLPAGYIEAGETPRRAIRRELLEEVSVDTRDFEYLGAQPWPGPHSLMLAFDARTVDPNPTPIPDRVEIDYAEFFSREEYSQLLRAEEIFAPRPSSIAASLLSNWLGEPLHYPQ